MIHDFLILKPIRHSKVVLDTIDFITNQIRKVTK
jgi:hypothetical protein